MAKRRKRTVEVEVQDLLVGVGIGTVGFGVSNLVTAKVAELTGSENTGNYSGGVKLAAAVATAFAANKYAKKYKKEAFAAALGMGLSGTLDLAKANLSAETLTLAGINAPGVYGAQYLGAGSSDITKRIAAQRAAGSASTRRVNLIAA